MGDIETTTVDVGRFFVAKGEEKNFLQFDRRQHHENTINDRLVFLPAFRKAVLPVLERNIDKEKLERVLEVGCGTGFFSRYLAPPWMKEKLVSFDINRIPTVIKRER